MKCPHLFEGLSEALNTLQDARDVVVIGTGPMTESLGEYIDGSNAAIIRCNDYSKATSIEEHWRPCSVQIINCNMRLSKKSSESILQWIVDNTVQVIVAEQDASKAVIERVVQDGLSRGLKMKRMLDNASKVVFKTDSTLGFLVLALATHAMIVVGGTVNLYGFGGTGHHNNPNQNIGHQIDEEWTLWSKLDFQKSRFTWHRNEIDEEYSAPIERIDAQAELEDTNGDTSGEPIYVEAQKVLVLEGQGPQALAALCRFTLPPQICCVHKWSLRVGLRQRHLSSESGCRA